jgi:hypothetical protein
MKLKSLKRLKPAHTSAPAHSSAMADLTYTYTILTNDGAEVTLKMHTGNGRGNTVRSVMKLARHGDTASGPVLKAIFWHLLNLLREPITADRDLVPALKQHWRELVDGPQGLVRFA